MSQTRWRMSLLLVPSCLSRSLAISLALMLTTGCASMLTTPRRTGQEAVNRGIAPDGPVATEDILCHNRAGTAVNSFVRLAEQVGEDILPLQAVDGRFTADRRSRIVICIDKDALAGDPIYSQGKISFQAMVGDRNIEVEGYASVGQQRNRLQSSALHPERFRIDYRTIAQRTNEAMLLLRGGSESTDDIERAASRAESVANILTSILDDADTALALSRVLSVSIPDLRRRNDVLRSAILDYQQARQDANAIPRRRQELQNEDRELEAKLQELDERIRLAEERRAAPTPLTPPMPEEIAARQEAERVIDQLRAQRSEAAFGRRRVGEQLSDLEDEGRWADRTRRRLLTALQDVSDAVPTLTEELAERITNFSNNLRRGGIGLEQQDIKAGDKLVITLLHFVQTNGGLAAEGTGQGAEPTAREHFPLILVDGFGLKQELLDSFLLIKRNREPEDATSTSNFKGGAGASVLWSITPRPRDRNFLTPAGLSWGLNVSYLDFDPEKEIEIGAGPVIGFFDNLVHTGVGWNLNVTDHRFYYYVGFSFGKIQEKLTGNGQGDD